jgi:hypothetical protein
MAMGTILAGLVAAGFVCASVHNGAGDLCVIKKVRTAHFTYDNPIGVYVPRNAPAQASRIVLHFHGFRGICDSNSDGAEKLLETYDLLGQMIKAGGDTSVLVFPVGVGQDTTFKQKFLGSGGEFAGFTDWIESLAGHGRWAISGHSGAGAVISGALAQNPRVAAKVESVDLLDAAYGMGGHLSEWRSIVKSSPHINITCVGNGTLPGCRTLAADVHGVSVVGTSVAHCQIPNRFFGAWVASADVAVRAD